MLSAVIPSEHSYPAMRLASQPVHQRFVHSGPLVLGADPLKFPAPTVDRDRTVSRRSKPSSRTSLNGEQPYPWDLLQPQDEMSRHRGAKHRRRYGPSIQNHRITKTYFRTCSTCLSRSQARFCLYTLRPISDQSERTFVLLRYSLGGDRPSQTTHQTWSSPRITGQSQNLNITRVVFQGRLHWNQRSNFKASHLSYTSKVKVQCQAAVKVHGVFPSSRGYTASSQRFRFH